MNASAHQALAMPTQQPALLEVRNLVKYYPGRGGWPKPLPINRPRRKLPGFGLRRARVRNDGPSDRAKAADGWQVRADLGL